MKISKSKQELARIISDNGGWRDGAKWATQDHVVAFFSGEKPDYAVGDKVWRANGDDGVFIVAMSVESKIKGFHNTILSREEYLHLYPALDAKPEFCNSVMRSIPEPEAKPTIEQMAADYRNAKDYAERKQQETDAAKADADKKLRVLEFACEAIGLLVSPIIAKQDHELVAAVKVGDEVECVESNIKRDKYNGMVGRLRTIDESDTSTPYLVDFGGEEKIWCHKVKFILRP